jgi:selenium donor protein
MPKEDSTVPKSGEEGESLDPSRVKLTHFTHGLGCACKLRPQALERVLSSLPPQFHNPNVLIGTETGDDAAVYKINEETALVSTLDFFTPIVDSPYHFGVIAAANSLSDVYAMGGQPLFALNIVGFPSNRLPLEVLTQILRGAQDKATEAGVSIVGGHTIDDLEPKYGMAVTGVVHPQKALSNRGGRPGDVLVLTKPIGTGIITTAIRRGVASKETEDRVIRVMSTLNKKAMEATHSLPSGSVHACTDVTGFGLLGHLRGMLSDDLDALIHSNRVPILPEAREFCAQDIVPGGTKNNQLFLEPHVRWDPSVTEVEKLLLCDAQTSGGILLALQPECLDPYLANCKALGLLDSDVAVIGSLQGNGSRTIRVLPRGST